MIARKPANLGLGLGLRGPHLAQWLRDPPVQVQWIEAITDNFLVNRGWLRRALRRLAAVRPVVLHGVGLNIGSVDPLDRDYLRQIKVLASEVQAPWVSDHLCWTGVDGLQSHDLLPMPYTTAALRWLVGRVRQVQDALERPLVLENPSSYLAFRASHWSEWDFVAELCERADCGLLLDVNNVHVSAHNHGFLEQDWLAAVPWSRVWQLHVAGHTTLATHKLDTHIGPVPDAVWRLYGQAWSRTGGCSTLLEWDDEIPDLDVAVRELCKARFWQGAPLPAPASTAVRVPSPTVQEQSANLRQLQRAILHEVVTARPDPLARRETLPNAALTAADRLAIHGTMYRLRLDDALREDFAKTAQLLGKRAFAAAVAAYRAAHPSRHWALELYGGQFSAWLAGKAEYAGDAAGLARLEWAVVQVRLAPGSEPLRPDWSEGLGGASLAGCRLRFASGLRVLRVNAAVWQYWSDVQAVGRTGRVLRLSPAGQHVAVHAMSPVEAAMLRQLRSGAQVMAACETVARRSPRWAEAVHSQLGQWLQRWVGDGLVVGVTVN